MKNNNVNMEEISLKDIISFIYKNKFFIIFFVFISTSFTTVYFLLQPNKYIVTTKLIPNTTQPNNIPGTINVLSTISGIPLNNFSQKISVVSIYKNLLDDYNFMKKFIIKNRFNDKFLDRKDYIYPKYGIILKKYFDKYFSIEEKKEKNITNFYIQIYKPFISNFIIKKTKEGLIEISYISKSRKFAYKVVKSFLAAASNYLIKKENEKIDRKIHKYKNLIKSIENIYIKRDLMKLISELLKRKVYLNTNKYYKVEILVEPHIPNKEEKIGPNRKTFIILSFVLSLVISIFIVLLKVIF